MGNSGSKDKNKKGSSKEATDCTGKYNEATPTQELQPTALPTRKADLVSCPSPQSSPLLQIKHRSDSPAPQPTQESTSNNSTPTVKTRSPCTPTTSPKMKNKIVCTPTTTPEMCRKPTSTPTGTPKSKNKFKCAPTSKANSLPTLQQKIELTKSGKKPISQKQGRVHSATVSAVNPTARSVTVEWFEKGETKGKEIEFDAVFTLNPDLAPQDQNAMPPPSKFDDGDVDDDDDDDDDEDEDVYSRQSQITQPAAAPVTRSKDFNRPRPSYLVKAPQNGEVRSNLQNKIGQSPARSTENISSSTVSKASSVPASRRRSNVVKEVDRIQKKREERRKQQAEKKEEKEALMNLDPGNPQWEFLNMIREFRSQLEFRTLKDGDPLEEHQITVAVRKRPLNKKEQSKREIDVITIPKRNTLYVHEPRTKVDLTKFLENQNFRFDYAFDETCHNELVYKYTARPLVQTIFEGGMATCFAYGQTGSGKTHTMGGDFQGKSQDCAKGIYAMVAKDVFIYTKNPKFRNLNLQVSASFFEIYGGKVFDLLNSKTKLRVLEDGKNVVQVVGLQERVCENVDDVLRLISLGSQVRTSGQTAANNQSSRSHAVFQIILRNLDKIEKQGDKAYKLHGKFSLIDLAGNERGADTSSANRQTRMEGAEINKSLLALKECIRALGRKGAHLPFRASKLTQVLRDSFIGDKSKTCMIAMISPGMSCCEHTLNTLRYADRVKELGVSDNAEDSYKTSPTEKEPDENGTNDADYSRLSNLNDNEMSADQQAFQVAMSALQEAEEEVVDLHGQYFAHRDKMDKMLIPLYQMTNEVDYDVDAYTQQLEDVVLENLEWWTQLRERVVKLRHQLEEEEKISRRQHV
ncbi:kinesin-like protein KIF2A isoform X3 [Panulirus ornatus]|uniref:kinesin-like protein KIF2A isoform X3 n=1 Tax=Panulirus ornatus TaxID=150431 RepID=UPI003A8AD528